VGAARALTRRREGLAVGALVLVAVAAWALAPTYPNYDAYFHLSWGRQLLRGLTPTFTAYAAPTEHPLYVALSALATLFGRSGERVLVLFTMLSWVALVYGTFRLGRSVFGWAAGLAAAAFVASSFAFLLYAVKAFVDMPFMTLAVWAGVLAAAERVRPVAVMTVLTLAGLLRPEVWPLAAGWWLWQARGRPGARPLVVLALVGLAAPLGWALCDLIVTGDPLYSVHSTSALAGALGRLRGPAALPGELVRFLASAVRPPVAVVAVAGVVLAWRRLGPRRLMVPLALLGGGVVAFFALGLVGQPVLPRYLTVPAVALCLFAGYAVFGWVGLDRSDPARRVWSRLGLGAVVAGVAFTALALPKFGRLTEELRFVRHSHDQLSTLVNDPAVAAARRCGPISFPTYRLVPDTRWLLDLPDSGAVARSDPGRHPGGPIVIVHGHKEVQRFGLAAGIPRSTNLHPRGWRVIARSGPLTAYALDCPGAA
jgi:hypothetical protein